MDCNFRITQGVELDGSFGNFDVHNAYALRSADLSSDGGTFCMMFEGNEFRLPDRPRHFQLKFGGVKLLEREGLPAHGLTDLVIHDVFFKSPDDREYNWQTDEDGEPGRGRHLVFRGDDWSIRVDADVATVVLVDA